MPVCVASAASAISGEVNYDIPISELNKVKKKSPSKRLINESRKKTKKDAKTRKASSGITAPTEPARETKTLPVESNSVTQREAVHLKPQAASEPLPESIRIHHAPYSFVVSGKRTVIHAVVNSKDDIQEVSCSLRMTEGGAQTLVKMTKVTSTRFTYMATLPGLLPENTSLRYTIAAVDSQGRNTRSQEFVTPVKASPVVPSWQLESAGNAISVEQEVGKKPLTGLSDTALPK